MSGVGRMTGAGQVTGTGQAIGAGGTHGVGRISDAVRVLSVVATVHGRCLLRPATQMPPRAVLVGFHGYAQNAEEHLAALQRIPDAARYHLAAVQGLHPFYRPRTRDIGASWMTALDRERAIIDNVAYVRSAIAEIQSAFTAADHDRAGVPTGTEETRLPLVYIGFSQGAAMAWRAAVLAGHRCDGMVAMVGDMPPELAAEDLSQLPPVLIGQGKEDEWYDDAKREADVDRLRAGGAEVETVVFSGDHDWHDEFYLALGRYLDAVVERGARS